MRALQVTSSVGSMRRTAAGRGPALAQRRPAQLRRLGSQMYSVVSSRALKRQATPAKSGARELSVKSPGSQSKRVSQLGTTDLHSVFLAEATSAS